MTYWIQLAILVIGLPIAQEVAFVLEAKRKREQ